MLTPPLYQPMCTLHIIFLRVNDCDELGENSTFISIFRFFCLQFVHRVGIRKNTRCAFFHFGFVNIEKIIDCDYLLVFFSLVHFQF